MHAITMPRWGMTMTEGKVAAWLVRPGDTIEPSHEILEIETSKITNTLEAPAPGVLRRVIAEAGMTLPVGALLGVIAASDASDAELDQFVARFAQRTQTTHAEGRDNASTRHMTAGPYTLNAVSAGEAGSVVVLLHGFGGEAATWLFNQATLAESHRVLALELPAHGASELGPLPANLESLADALGDGLEALGEPVHLVGHSLGGGLAMLIASRRPQLVSSLALIAPVGLGPEIDADYVHGFIAADRRKAMQGVLSRLFLDPSRITRDMVDASLQTKRMDGVGEWLQALAGTFLEDRRQRIDLRASLDAMPHRTLLLWGEADDVVPPPRDRPVHRIADAAHMPQMEQSSEVNRLLAEHLAAAVRGPG